MCTFGHHSRIIVSRQGGLAPPRATRRGELKMGVVAGRSGAPVDPPGLSNSCAVERDRNRRGRRRVRQVRADAPCTSATRTRDVPLARRCMAQGQSTAVATRSVGAPRDMAGASQRAAVDRRPATPVLRGRPGPTVRWGRVHQGHGRTAGLGVLFASQWRTQEAECLPRDVLRRSSPPTSSRDGTTARRCLCH